MISRRQIIASGQPQSGDQSTSSASSQMKTNSKSAAAVTSRQQQQAKNSKEMSSSAAAAAKVKQQDSDDYIANTTTTTNNSQNLYEDYPSSAVDAGGHLSSSWRPGPVINARPAPPPRQQQRQVNNQEHLTNANEALDAYRHFDPYSIYSDEEDVWYSEERLFEDHLDEIYNKWPLLDDDIWCKLIIMERNRRIGKAYARVPIVTIDGSHELSYDGYKLALNGFDNPDRDDETEECRKRIGKGMRIKMDNFGNILIKRLAKSGVYVKEWINPSAIVSGGSSNSTNGSSGAGVGRSMPSRQQLIKAASMGGQMSSLANSGTPTLSSSGGSSMDTPNDTAICDEVINIGGRLNLDKIYVLFDMKKFQANIGQELCRPYPDRRKLEQQCFSIVGLTCDSEDILNLPCWVMVINIVAMEMLNERFPLSDHHGRHGLSDFPDSRRLSQPQAPSFVSIFDHPAAARGKSGGADQLANNNEEDPYSMPANASSSDIKSSINDYGTTSTKNMSNYIESTANHSSRFYGTPKSPYMAPNSRRGVDMSGLAPPSSSRQSELLMMRNRSKSQYNIYGMGAAKTTAPTRYTERYNNSSSIYSPGHMLVPPSGDHSVPPKLPPRDFVSKRGKSRSSTNVNSLNDVPQMDQMPPSFDDRIENIYTTRDELNGVQQEGRPSGAVNDQMAKAPRKTKRSRFLESLKAPLELAKSGRSASVMGAPSRAAPLTEQQQNNPTEGTKKSSSKTKSSGGFSKARNLRSLLGVGGKSSSSSSSSSNANKDSNSDTNNYVHGDESKTTKGTNIENADADSAVDPNDELDNGQQIASDYSPLPLASYNDLDIPTPDYETDENIYTLDQEGSTQANYSNNNNNTNKRNVNGATSSTNNNNNNKNKANTNRTRRYSTSNQEADVKATKDDLYYSGFRAHVPHGINHQPFDSSGVVNGTPAYRYNHGPSSVVNGDDRMSCVSGPVPRDASNSRYLMRTSRMLAAKMGGREKIYGSTLGLHQQQSMTGSRYRSASMQRYYPSTMRSGAQISDSPGGVARDYDYPTRYRVNRSHQEIAYDPDIENPYAMSAGLASSAMLGAHHDDQSSHYGITTTASSCIGGGGGATSRRRSVSKMMPAMQARNVAPSLVGSTNHYDIGRSSSGIYGNHSSSSSSEYADWHPQVRKVNSSGYLNSIFKSHKLNSSVTATANMSGPSAATNAAAFNSNNSGRVDSLNNNNNNSSNNNHPDNDNNNIINSNKTLMTARGYQKSMNVNNGAAKKSSQVRNYATRAVKTMQTPCDNTTNTATAAAAIQNGPTGAVNKQSSVGLNGPAYRSYDSSNDSDPSYTNSSDGLDIYDQIGAHTRANHQHQHHQHQHHHNQFLDHNLAPEVHVGEWENLYDR